MWGDKCVNSIVGILSNVYYYAEYFKCHKILFVNYTSVKLKNKQKDNTILQIQFQQFKWNREFLKTQTVNICWRRNRLPE